MFTWIREVRQRKKYSNFLTRIDNIEGISTHECSTYLPPKVEKHQWHGRRSYCKSRFALPITLRCQSVLETGILCFASLEREASKSCEVPVDQSGGLDTVVEAVAAGTEPVQERIDALARKVFSLQGLADSRDKATAAAKVALAATRQALLTQLTATITSHMSAQTVKCACYLSGTFRFGDDGALRHGLVEE